MPHEENRDLFPVFIPDSEIVWRFIDFAKFMALVEDKALFICRSDRLGDDFEGHYSRPPLKENVTYISAEARTYYNVEIDEQEIAMTKQRNAELRTRVFINCWNWKDYESYSLWRLYSANKGVAIQSTIGRLKQSLSSCSEHVHIGPVTYIDWDKQDIPLGNSLYPFVHKRNNFESEHEDFARVASKHTFQFVGSCKGTLPLILSSMEGLTIDNAHTRKSLDALNKSLLIKFCLDLRATIF